MYIYIYIYIYIYMYIYIYKLTSKCHSQTTPTMGAKMSKGQKHF